MSGNRLVTALALGLTFLLIALIVRSLRRAFRRPGSSATALQNFSLSTGRIMMLTAVLGLALLSQWAIDLTGSSATLVGVLGIAALLIQMITETRWPRQSGAVRVALLRHSTVGETVRTRYLVGSALAVSFALGALAFFWTVDPGVKTRGPSELVTNCPAVANAICTSGSFGTSTVPGFGTAPPQHSALLIAAAALLLMASLAPVAIRQILRRPSLAGVVPAVDHLLRQIAAERVLRAVSAACLASVIASITDLRNALSSYAPGRVDLAQALEQFLSLVTVGCVVGLLVLYLVGPNDRTLRKAWRATMVTGA